jgi:hypothetical protein
MGGMKANYFLLTLLIFASLFSSLILTSPEYVQCQHSIPDEFLDLSGIPKNSPITLTGSTFHSSRLFPVNSLPKIYPLQFYSAEISYNLASMLEIVSTITLRC